MTLPVEKPTEYKSRRNPLYDALVGAAEKLLQAVKGCEGRSNRDLKYFAEQIRSLTDKILK